LNGWYPEARPIAAKQRSYRKQTTDPIVFAVAANFLFAFSAQKTHVKSKNQLTRDNPTTSALKFSYAQTAILNIEIKIQASPVGIFRTLRG
jgi:hypothetical protein